jgi:hypothetical protein
VIQDSKEKKVMEDDYQKAVDFIKQRKFEEELKKKEYLRTLEK